MMANTVAAPDNNNINNNNTEGGDFAARLAALKLPSRPLIMSKHDRPCSRHPDNNCYCYEYITLLERPEYEGKYMAESPPEIEVAKRDRPALNGATGAKKKLKLSDYLTKTSGGGKSERRKSAEPEAVNSKAEVNTTTTTAATEKSNATPTKSAPSAAAAAKLTNGKLPRDLQRDVPTPRTDSSSQPPPTQPHPQSQTKMSTTGSNSSSTASRNGATATPIASGKMPAKLVPEKRPAAADSTKPSSNAGKTSTPSRYDSSAPPPRKRQRTPSPPPPSSARTSRLGTSPQRQPRPAKPTTSTAAPPQLPPLLSPTLPKVIEDALAAEARDERLRKGDKAKSGATRTSADKASKSASSAGIKPPAPVNSARSPRPSAGTEQASKTLPKKSGLGISLSSKSAASSTAKRAISPRPPSKTAGKASSNDRQFLVKFKFSKRRKEFAQLCRLTAGKRPRPASTHDDDPRATKRQRPAVTAASRATARSPPPSFKSPALKRERDLTTPPPRKPTTALKRADSKTAITPTAGRNGTGSSAGGEPEDRRWFDDYQKFSNLGKQAKHESDKIFRKVPSPDLEDAKYALAAAVDSMLCFILSFIISDRNRRATDNKPPAVDMWRTYIPLSQFVAGKAREFKLDDLAGLCKLLEAVVRQYIHDLDISTFTSTPLPDSTPRAPTPDSTNPSPPNDITQYTRMKTLITRGSLELRECWADAMRVLPFETIQRDYPATYDGRSSKWIEAAAPGGWPSRVGRYRHAYALPLHRNTSPQEALGFGRAFMEEWGRRCGVGYRSRLEDVL